MSGFRMPIYEKANVRKITNFLRLLKEHGRLKVLGVGVVRLKRYPPQKFVINGRTKKQVVKKAPKCKVVVEFSGAMLNILNERE